MSVRSKQGRTKYNADWENPSLHSEMTKWMKQVNSGNPLHDICYCQWKVCNSEKIS